MEMSFTMKSKIEKVTEDFFIELEKSGVQIYDGLNYHWDA
jgi:hypothetical protein